MCANYVFAETRQKVIEKSSRTSLLSFDTRNELNKYTWHTYRGFYAKKRRIKWSRINNKWCLWAYLLRGPRNLMSLYWCQIHVSARKQQNDVRNKLRFNYQSEPSCHICVNLTRRFRRLRCFDITLLVRPAESRATANVILSHGNWDSNGFAFVARNCSPPHQQHCCCCCIMLVMQHPRRTFLIADRFILATRNGSNELEFLSDSKYVMISRQSLTLKGIITRVRQQAVY